MTTGVYKITCNSSGNFYIGSAVDINIRWMKHRHELRKGTHHSNYLQNSWNKYGESNFEFCIIEECSEVTEREQYWIDTLKPKFNTCPIAYSSLGRKHSEEAKMKMSASKLGRPITDKHKENISIGKLGHVVSDETKSKMRESAIRRWKNKGKN